MNPYFYDYYGTQIILPKERIKKRIDSLIKAALSKWFVITIKIKPAIKRLDGFRSYIRRIIRRVESRLFFLSAYGGCHR